MPRVITGNPSKSQIISPGRFDYNYPRGGDFSPNDDHHWKIVSSIMNRAEDAHSALSPQHSHWKELDKLLNVYVPDGQKQKKSNNTDDFKVVIPTLYATRETLLTYMASAFFQDPMFKYQATGPEDKIGAMMLERLVNFQAQKQTFALNKYTQWKDAFTYGFGIDIVRWKEEWGYKREAKYDGVFDSILESVLRIKKTRIVRKRHKKYEGNELVNISPYLCFPDPSQPIDKPKTWEYFGFITSMSLMDLLKLEEVDNDFFNVKYLKHLTKPHSKYKEESINDYNSSTDKRRADTNMYSKRVDIMWMYIDLIPDEWGLGNKKSPEKWLLGVAADSVLIYAAPSNLDHNEIPATVCAPETDGYNGPPVSRMSLVSGLQKTVDFMYNSHIMNIRKAINDMLLVDPSLVNILDLQNPKPGKLVRMRKRAWGGNKMDQAVKQLEVSDITGGNISTASLLEQHMKSSVGANDQLQGSLPDRSSRISANEIQGARSAGMSKLKTVASIISMQSIAPTAYYLGMHTQQFMEKDHVVKITGEYKQKLEQDFGVKLEREDFLPIGPVDILGDFDVIPSDGTVPGNEDPQMWIQLYQIIAQNPALQQKIDMFRVFKHIARQMGASNIDDFANVNVSSDVMDEEMLQKEVDKGNLRTVEE